MTTADLVNRLDEQIDSLTEPLFDRYAAGDENAREIARQLGLHLLDRGCSIVARSGLPLAGLDAAVVAAQDRAHTISAEQVQFNDKPPERLFDTHTNIVPTNTTAYPSNFAMRSTSGEY